jgi:predicted nucleic acid-binding protein
LTHYFLDSSALVKRYVAEQGTAWMRAISVPGAGNAIVVAPVTQVEVFSGVSRRKREGIITPRTAQAVRLLLNRHIQRAQDLLDQHPLRAYDAIQLASALIIHTRLLTVGLAPLIFVSSDTRLLAAAVAEGLAIDDANVHPQLIP